VQKIEAHNWILTYIMFNRREIARLITRVVIEAMVSNKFPKSLNIMNREEGDEEKNGEDKPLNRSLSQGNYPINKVNKQTLSSSSVGPNKSTNLHNSSTTKGKSQRIPDRRPRSTCGSLNLQKELSAQGDKSDNNTIPIRRNKEKQTRPRSKTQNQTQEQQALTKSQKSPESSSKVIIKKRPTNNPPVKPPEAPQSNYELLSTINFHYHNSPDPLNVPFPLSLHHPSNPPQTNPFIFDNLIPFKDISSNSLPKSQPQATAFNPFLTPEVIPTHIPLPNNIPNTQIPSYHNNNPFLQN